MMDTDTIVLIVFGGLNIFGWVYYGKQFTDGNIYSKGAVDKIVEGIENITIKQAREISGEIRAAVKDGVVDAYREMNGSVKK